MWFNEKTLTYYGNDEIENINSQVHLKKKFYPRAQICLYKGYNRTPKS